MKTKGRQRRNPDFAPGDVVHFTDGWGKDAVSVTATVVGRYLAQVSPPSHVVRFVNPLTGRETEVAVFDSQLHPGPAVNKVLPFKKRNPKKRRNPDLSGPLTIAHEASGDVVIRHVAHNPSGPTVVRAGTSVSGGPLWHVKQGGRVIGTITYANSIRMYVAAISAKQFTIHDTLTEAAATFGAKVRTEPVLKNPARRQSVVNSSPDRYISVLTNSNDGVRRWQVIGHGGLPETREGGRDEAIWSFKRFDKNTKDADIPVWDGDLGTFTTIGSVKGRANPARRLSLDKSSPKRRQNPALSEAAADIVQQALARYGANLTPEGFIQKGDKTLRVSFTQKGKKLCIEGGGRLLASGPIAEKTVQSFVEGFWFWKKANPRIRKSR